MRLTMAGFVLTAVAGAVQAQPAMVFDVGGKFDKSFNEAAYNGAEAYKKDSGNDYMEFEVTNEGQRELALTRMAQRGGNPIVAAGFAQASSMDKVAQQFPETKFVIIDSVVEQPNVRSVEFKEHEGSFLVGALAAMATKNDAVGFIGGMDIPLIRRFACGYSQGAKHVQADIKVFENMTGTTGAAWNNPTKGGELARSQFERGADVVFAAAGGTGIGVYQTAADEGKLAIGVDSNINHLHPGTMLTSMVKRVDVAVQNAFADADAGTLQGDKRSLGLAEGGVDWALDEHNRSLVSQEMETAIQSIREKIISGEIKVHNYTDDNNCPS